MTTAKESILLSISGQIQVHRFYLNCSLEILTWIHSQGDVTLLNDVNATSYGSDMTFHKGYCGTYNATSNELHLSFEFSGYDIGGGTYDFTISQQ